MIGRQAHPEWALACSWCKARPGQRCTTVNGRRLSIPSHDCRITAWQDHQAAQATLDQQTGDTTE